ncbi:MAG TPA: filamentous hemagglutinin N-terminal domain-containing protein [Rhodospirillaceae bacterium]|nr:filamentous hemagglutinin N-terminal domain-containing protein [Rhodospirillaceae bacterium]
MEPSGRWRNVFGFKATLCMTTCLSVAGGQAWAGPSGAQIVAGQVNISAAAQTTIIQQNSSKAIINWQDFSLGRNETLNFKQPDAKAIALNRVTGTQASSLQGTVAANGQVWIINPNGVLFGAGSQVNVAGLIATTADIADQDFLAGNYSFGKPSPNRDAAIANWGRIQAAEGSYAVLAGGQVNNAGTVTATLGSVVVGGTKTFAVDFHGDKLLSFAVTGPADQAGSEVTNSGTLAADGGLVQMTARAAGAVIDSVVNTSGVIHANSVSVINGRVILDGGDGSLTIGGSISATGKNLGETGGTITATGGKTKVADGAVLDASGEAGGGTIETSGHLLTVGAAKVNTGSAHGKSGSWLLDPYDLTIDATAAAAINGALGSGGVTLQTTAGSATTAYGGTASSSGSGDIIIGSPITWSSNQTLTLDAYHSVLVNANITASGNTAGLTVKTNDGGSGGNLLTGAGASVTLSGTSPTLTINSQAYTLVKTPADLQAMGTSGLYALAGNIDMTGFGNFTPIGFGGGNNGYPTEFTGTFNGLGHTILNLVIYNTSARFLGFFSVIASPGIVTNVGLVGGSLTGGSSSQFGILAGSNGGTINNAYANGSVSGGGGPYASCWGGLAGQNDGTIWGSYATGTVSGSGSNLGGLVGLNNGTILSSYATGSVTGNSYIGGLVGNAPVGLISSSHAIGAVSGTGWIGGLAGQNSGIVSGSYATGTVSGSSKVGGLAGVSYGPISSSYATGAVSGGDLAGGLVGDLNSGTISSSYASGSVSSSGIVGGLVGGNGGIITSSYWDKTSSGQTVGSGNGSTSGMTGWTGPPGSLPSGFASSVWGIQSGYNGGYPFLYTTSSGGAIVIGNVSVLESVNANPNLSGSYTLAANLDLTGFTWNPIGSSGTPFTGIFNGGGYTISGLTINQPANNYIGLFGYNSGTIRNLALTGEVITGGWWVGGLAGANTGTIQSSYATGSVSGGKHIGGLAGDNSAGTILSSYAAGTVSGVMFVGGVVGANSGLISASYATAAVTGGNGVAYIGGLVGNNGGTVANSYATGSVSAGDGASYDIGGLVGQSSTGTVSSSYATGPVTAGSGTYNIGGLAGNIVYGSTISSSYATGAVSAGSGATNIGGLVGLISSNSPASMVTSSYATGSVTAGSGSSSVGGLAGYSAGAISSSYATGSVAAGSGATYIGGLVGGNGSGGLAAYSYATGTVSATNGGSAVGGLIGENDGVASSSYATGGVASGTSTLAAIGTNTGTATSVGMLSYTNSFSQSRYSGWSFATTPTNGIWYMVDGYTRPILASEYSTTITNAHQLELANLAMGASYTLGSNISMAELSQASGAWNSATGFAPIGSSGSHFTGTFDGSGYTINGLTINLPANSNVGFIGYNSGTIKNLTLTGVSINGSWYIGGLLGYNAGGAISSSYATGSVGGLNQVGGLVGYNSGSIAASSVAGTITGSLGGPVFVGGLVGLNAGTIASSYATGSVTTGTGATYIGGLVGWNNSGMISSSYATGPVSCGSNSNDIGGLVGMNQYGTILSSHASGSVYVGSGAGNIGGLVGVGLYVGTVLSSYATGSVSADNGAINIGGLVGFNSSNTQGGATISNSYATGSVAAGNGSTNVGGLTGANAGPISSSYATGSVTVGSGSQYIGGLVGASSDAIKSSYATGSIAASPGVTAVGGLVGGNSGNVSSSYWDKTTSGQVTSSGGTGVATTADWLALNLAANSNWNGGAWTFISGHPYPLLSAFPYVTVSIAPASKTYGQANPAFSANIVSASDGSGNGSTSGLVLSSPASTSSPVGSYGIYASGSPAGGYQLDYVPGTLTVGAALLNLGITATDLSKTYGTAITLSSSAFTTSGLTGSDSVTGVTLTSAGTPASAGTGTYSIIPSSATGPGLGNYTITYTNGTLTVNKAPLALSAGRVYDGTTSFAASLFTAGNLVNGDCAGGLVACGLSGSASAASKNVSAGAQSLTLTGLSLTNANYTLSGASGTGSITAQTITYTAPFVSKTYDGTTSATGTPAVTSGALVSGDALSSSTLAFSDPHAGSGTKTVALTGVVIKDAGGSGNDMSGNYSVTAVANTVSTILPQTLTIT